MRELNGVGLVVSIPNKGAMVAKAKTEEELRKFIEICIILEGKAAEFAAQKIESPDIDALKALNDKMAAQASDPSDYFFLNQKFHLDLYQTSGQSLLCQIIRMMYDRMQILQNTFPFQPENIKKYIEYHHRLREALGRRDCVTARKVIAHHAHDGLPRLDVREWCPGMVLAVG